MTVLLANYYPGDAVKNDKGGASGTYEGRGDVHTGFC